MKYLNAIIIEGPDCSGKSTLAEVLKEYYTKEFDAEMSIMHCTGHDPADYDFYYQLARKKNVIYDRHFIGETIYPEIFGRDSQLSPIEYHSLCHKLKEMRVPVVVVAPPVNVLINRLSNERPNEEIEIVNTIKKAREAFYDRAKYNPYFILVDPEDGQINYEELISKINNILGLKEVYNEKI